MDEKIIDIFDKTLNKDFVGAIISNSTEKAEVSKIKIRPVLLKGSLLYQVSEYRGQKIYHSNHTEKELMAKLPEWFQGLFRQAEITTKTSHAHILISKKGKATIVLKNDKPGITMNESHKAFCDEDKEKADYLHDKRKNYILEEGKVLPFLVDLGVMSEEGRIIKSKSDKFRQINRFLEFVEDILTYLDKDRELTILDFGCGKSYLTFALYYYLKEQKGYCINVIGLDLKSDVINNCNLLSEKYGFDKLRFQQGDIASYSDSEQVDMVVTLHACDTATDHALQKAVTWGARVILSVPCCQHELNKQIQNELLQPILKYGIIKERVSALITDALRAELLEQMGYRVQLLEFIDMEHTPKNILIRAIKKDKKASHKEAQEKRLRECMSFLGVNPCLARLLNNKEEKGN